MSSVHPIRQHLIDPEICIRCNTCEESCPIDAVTHNDDNYVVDASKCESCLHCISPCPTGAIDNWRMVGQAYSIEEQMGWEELPPQRQQETADAKTAHGLIRGTDRFRIIGVIDPVSCGEDAGEVLDGYFRNIPVFDSILTCLDRSRQKPD